MKDRIVFILLLVFIAGAVYAFSVYDSDQGAKLCDNAGYIASASRGMLAQSLPAYRVDAASGVTQYVAYSASSSALILRYTTLSSITTVEKSIGAWASRASLTYSPVND